MAHAFAGNKLGSGFTDPTRTYNAYFIQINLPLGCI
jgi:hypothetical protein